MKKRNSIIGFVFFAVLAPAMSHAYGYGNDGCSSTFSINNRPVEIREDYYGNRVEIIGRTEYENYRGYRIPKDMYDYDKREVQELIDDFQRKYKRMCPTCIDAPKGDCCKCKKK